MPLKVLAAALALVLAGCAQLGDEELYEAAFSDVGGEADFEAVQTLFNEACVSCHQDSTEDTNGDLSLEASSVVAELFGENGEGVAANHPDCAGLDRVVPGEPEQSCMWILVDEGKMPVNNPLPDPQKELLRAWIAAGASTESS